MSAAVRLCWNTVRRVRLLLLAAALCSLLLAPRPAHALCLGLCSCTTSVTNVVFSAYQPLANTNVDSTGSVRVTCGGVVGLLIPMTLSLSKGTGTSYASRSMGSGSNRLAYNLYSTTLRTTIVGDGTGGSSTLAGGVLLDVLGASTPQVWTLYGRIPSGQTTAIPGSYADTIVVTVTYQ